jgi:flagellar biosynthesis protein FlhG
MNDQATTLRRMASVPKINLNVATGAAATIDNKDWAVTHSTRTIAITGGKGGVGKSNVAVNLALALASRGRRVTLLDADLGLANADVLMGLNPQFHLGHVLMGQRELSEVVVETEGGVRLIPGGSGIEDLANMTSDQHPRLVAELRAMEETSEYMIIDTAAGIGGNVTGVLKAAAEVVVVTTPDPTAVVDAYALIKVLHQHSPTKSIRIIVNDVVGIGDAEQTFTQLRGAVLRFLGHSVEHLGTIPRDPELAEAVREQVPVFEYAPDTPASRAFRLIAKHLDQPNETKANVKSVTARSFWNLLVESEA